MAKHKIFRYAILIVALLALLAAFAVFYQQEKSMCMGVRILSDEAFAELQQGTPEKVDNLIYQDDMPVAMDAGSSMIYISQNITETTYLAELNGILNVTNSAYSLAFAPDKAFSDLFAAVGEGHTFRLLVIKEGLCCKEYGVVFTNLPVLRLSAKEAATEEGETGDVTVWTPLDPDTDKYSVKASPVQWYVRGGSSLSLRKKSFKLNLKATSGNNQNMALLGMGKDDDWILNAMAADDLKIREITVGSVWQKLQETAQTPQKMSYGNYVEVIINDAYQGLYLLQRRIDEKYLELDSNHILLKGGVSYTPTSAEVAFETKYCPYGEDVWRELVTAYYEGCDPEHIQLDNWIDVSLLCQIGCLVDNRGYKNMYYLWDLRQEKYTISLLPWDTDMAFGYGWDNARGVIYEPEEQPSNLMVHRQEYAQMQEVYPNLDTSFAERWAQLRNAGLSADYVWCLAEAHKAQLFNSGVYCREVARWGIQNNNADTFEGLQTYIENRFAALDAYYKYAS